MIKRYIQPTTDLFWLYKFSNEEIRLAIDDFYTDPANIRVTMKNAFVYEAYKLNGSTKEFLDNLLDGLKQEAASR